MKANGNEGCRSLLTSLWAVRTCEQVRAHAPRAALLTLPCRETGLPAHLDLGTHIPEAGHLCSPSQQRVTVKGRGGSKDLPWREAVIGPKLVFLKLAGDFVQHSCYERCNELT